MAKIHKSAEKFPIQWDGKVVGGEKEGDNVPSSVTLKWAGEYVPCWYPNNYSDCVIEDMYFEDFDVAGVNSSDLNPNGILNVDDGLAWNIKGRNDIQLHLIQIILGNIDIPAKAPISLYDGYLPYTWGDANFIQEIMDGIGTGSRRARQDRLNKILDDEDKKKKLIHLICRIKGEKVYDDYTEVGDVEVKVDDVELVAENIIGKIKLEIKSGV